MHFSWILILGFLHQASSTETYQTNSTTTNLEVESSTHLYFKENRTENFEYIHSLEDSSENSVLDAVHNLANCKDGKCDADEQAFSTVSPVTSSNLWNLVKISKASRENLNSGDNDTVLAMRSSTTESGDNTPHVSSLHSNDNELDSSVDMEDTEFTKNFSKFARKLETADFQNESSTMDPKNTSDSEDMFVTELFGIVDNDTFVSELVDNYTVFSPFNDRSVSFNESDQSLGVNEVLVISVPTEITLLSTETELDFSTLDYTTRKEVGENTHQTTENAPKLLSEYVSDPENATSHDKSTLHGETSIKAQTPILNYLNITEVPAVSETFPAITGTENLPRVSDTLPETKVSDHTTIPRTVLPEIFTSDLFNTENSNATAGVLHSSANNDQENSITVSPQMISLNVKLSTEFPFTEESLFTEPKLATTHALVDTSVAIKAMSSQEVPISRHLVELSTTPNLEKNTGQNLTSSNVEINSDSSISNEVLPHTTNNIHSTNNMEANRSDLSMSNEVLSHTTNSYSTSDMDNELSVISSEHHKTTKEEYITTLFDITTISTPVVRENEVTTFNEITHHGTFDTTSETVARTNENSVSSQKELTTEPIMGVNEISVDSVNPSSGSGVSTEITESSTSNTSKGKTDSEYIASKDSTTSLDSTTPSYFSIDKSTSDRSFTETHSIPKDVTESPEVTSYGHLTTLLETDSTTYLPATMNRKDKQISTTTQFYSESITIKNANSYNTTIQPIDNESTENNGFSESYKNEYTFQPTLSPEVSSSITETHREGKHIPISPSVIKTPTESSRIINLTTASATQPKLGTDINDVEINVETLTPKERSSLINAIVRLPPGVYSKEELNEKMIIIHLWMLHAIADEYKNLTFNLSEDGRLNEVEFENLPQILYIVPAPEVNLPNISFMFIVQNSWRNETLPVEILLTILNLHSEDLKHLVDIEDIYFTHGLLVEQSDLLTVIIEKYGTVLIATCIITVGMIFLLICIVIYYRRKTRHSAHCLTDDKLHRNIQEAMGIDLNPAVIILEDEIREKSALNGNKICSIDDDEGWLAPIGDVPVAEDNNAPSVQDTKL